MKENKNMRYSNSEIKQRQDRMKKCEREYGPELWHYTDLKALDGILRGKEIWCGRTENMNDSLEIKGFIDSLKKEVRGRVGAEKETAVSEIFGKVDERLNGEYPFIFCLSRALDDAAQWERYANGGQGIAISFNTQKLVELLYYNRIMLKEEYYTLEVKKHKLTDLLEQYIQENDSAETTQLEELIDNVFLCATIRKHPSFSAEKEVRLWPLFAKLDNSKIQYKIGEVIKAVYVINLDTLCKKGRG